MATCCERLSCSNLSTDSSEDDGTLFTEDKDGKHYFLPGDIVQPLSSIEMLMGVGGYFGTLNTVQAIWLDSKKPINTSHVSEALWILSRQLPHLQFCMSRRGMTLWFKRMKKFSLDFEVTTQDVMEVYQNMIESTYNLLTGPLWKVKLVMPNEENKNEPKSACLIFSVQHSITDGTTNMKLCRETVEILNKMSRGEEVVPKQIPLAPVIDEIISDGPRYSFLAKYFFKKFGATIIKNFYHKTSFKGSFPVPKTKHANTRVLFDDFTKAETKNLIKMCKAAKVTVHSFIMAITNFSLLTVAQSRSASPIGRKGIASTHCVNTRRYMDPKYSDTSGCHISFLEDKSKFALTDARDFWNVTKKLNNTLKEKLDQDKIPITIVPILQLATMIFPLNSFLTKKGYKNKTDCHYVTTNMGNLKDMLPGPKEDDDIEITYLLRSVSSEVAGNPFLLTYHTFRERFMISIDYYTNKMTPEIAQEFFGILCQYIRNMTNFNALHDAKTVKLISKEFL